MPIMKNPAGTVVFDKYPREHGFEGRRVLNIGCGFAKYPAKNVVNLDAFDNCKPDVVHDLAQVPMPFKDETFDLILANHVLEHVPNWWACFEELCRIVKVGGYVQVWVPGTGNDSQLGFRDHINVINQCSFFGTKGTFRNPANAWAAAHCAGPVSKVKLVRQDIILERTFAHKVAPEFVRLWMAKHLRNTVAELHFKFQREDK